MGLRFATRMICRSSNAKLFFNPPRRKSRQERFRVLELNTPHPGADRTPEAAPPTPLATHQAKGGKGETAQVPALHVTNGQFIQAVFHSCPAGAAPLICSKPGDPQQGGFPAQRATDVDAQC